MSSARKSADKCEVDQHAGLCRTHKRPRCNLPVSLPYPRPLSAQPNLGGSDNLPSIKITGSRISNARVETDVLVAIKPLHLARIVNREKNFEFRKYRLKNGVERIWFYETAGDTKEGRGRASITHIATTSPSIRYIKGQVPEVPAGVGNHEFNAGLKESKYAYPILNLYELVPAVSLKDMQTRWKLGPPMGWMYIKKELWEIKWGDLGPENEAVVQLF